jgi:hypothetical protein
MPFHVDHGGVTFPYVVCAFPPPPSRTWVHRTSERIGVYGPLQNRGRLCTGRASWPFSTPEARYRRTPTKWPQFHNSVPTVYGPTHLSRLADSIGPRINILPVSWRRDLMGGLVLPYSTRFEICQRIAFLGRGSQGPLSKRRPHSALSGQTVTAVAPCAQMNALVVRGLAHSTPLTITKV